MGQGVSFSGGCSGSTSLAFAAAAIGKASLALACAIDWGLPSRAGGQLSTTRMSQDLLPTVPQYKRTWITHLRTGADAFIAGALGLFLVNADALALRAWDATTLVHGRRLVISAVWIAGRRRWLPRKCGTVPAECRSYLVCATSSTDLRFERPLSVGTILIYAAGNPSSMSTIVGSGVYFTAKPWLSGAFFCADLRDGRSADSLQIVLRASWRDDEFPDGPGRGQGARRKRIVSL